jgi:hypothetical protein
MKQDKLEQFIIENRKEFDVFEPGDDIWQRIQQSQSQRKAVFRWKKTLLRVSAVVTIFISSYYFHDMMHRRSNNNPLVNETTTGDPMLARFDLLAEAELFYASRIAGTKQEIVSLAGDNNDLIDEINYDLTELDAVFEELKNDLRDNADNEEVIEAMIQNYRIKLDILEEILLQLKSSGNPANEKQLNDEI